MNHRRRDHDIKRLNRVEDTDDEHLDGDAPGAHVIADDRRLKPPETAQQMISALKPRSDLCVVVVTTSQCSKGEGCCFVAARPEM